MDTDGRGHQKKFADANALRSSRERWRLAGEFRFLAPDQPAGRRRSQEVLGGSEIAATFDGGSFTPLQHNPGFKNFGFHGVAHPPRVLLDAPRVQKFCGIRNFEEMSKHSKFSARARKTAREARAVPGTTAREYARPTNGMFLRVFIILSWSHYLDALPGRGRAVAPVSTGEQLFDHDHELVGLEMMQLDGAGRAFGGANAAAHALGGFNLSLAVLVAVGRGIRTDGDAGHAGDALLLVHVRNLGADVELRLGQDGGRPRGGGARLRDVFINELRRMGQAAEEYAFGGEIHGPQFHVGFHVETIGVKRHFEHVGDALVVLQIHFHAGAEHDVVGLDGERVGEVGTLERDDQPVVVGHLRRRFRRVTDEDHPGFARLLVVYFPEAVGPDVAVKHIDVRIRVPFLDVERVFDGHRAADAAAIRMLFVARADALDHDNVLSLRRPGFVVQPLFQFDLGQDPVGLAV